MALRTEIEEKTDRQLLVAAIHKKFRPTTATFDGLPAGSHLTVLAINSTARLNDAQMNALETAIEKITGGGISITATKVLSQGPVNGTPNIPGHSINLAVETKLDVVPE